MKTNRINLLTSIFVLSCFFSGTGYGHGTVHDEAAHQQEDAFLAQKIREQEASGNAVLQKYFNHLIAYAPVKTLLSEMVSAVVGEQVNAAVGDVPALYGQWGAVTNWPFAFASAANLPDGRILAWGGNLQRNFNGGTFTYAAIWNPTTGTMVSANHSSHSLFCGIPVMLEDGRVFVSGGDQANASSVRGTSTFDYVSQSWTRIQDMAVGRWYNGAVALPNGQVFSALGEPGSAYPEIWTPGTGVGSGWSYLNGASLQTAALNYPTVTEPKNWLPHLHLAPNGKIFHSGHTPQMNYIDTANNGSVTPVALINDWNTANTPSILFDEGKILQTGGALYDANNTSTTKSALINLNSSVPSRTATNNMQFPRIFHNQVVLPNGEVMVIGGNTTGTKFDDVGSQLTPEIWNPITQTWRAVADMQVARNYHSVALLMTDGRVWSGGGGLCDCAADHPDSQVYSPSYLFNNDGTLAARPEIINAPTVVSYGRTISVIATPGVSKFSMVRMSSTTHALNSDMRFLNVPFTVTNTENYELSLHTNRNVMAPGYWMLFALNQQGVPSLAKIVKVSTSNAPSIVNPGDQYTLINTNVTLNPQAGDPNGDALTFSATALPQGLTINSNTGAISGKPTSVGNSRVTISVSDGIDTATVSFVWNIVSNQTPIASPVFGGVGGTPFTDNVTATQLLTGINIRGAGWIDSLQGILNTGALTQHGGMGGVLNTVTWPADEYLVRSYGIYGTYVGQISFVTNTGRVLGPYGDAWGDGGGTPFDYSVPAAGFEIVGFTGRAGSYLNALGFLSRVRQSNNQPPLVTTIANQIHSIGEPVNLAVNATDPDGDALTFSALGLPEGLNIAAGTGLINGSPTIAGTYSVIVTVQDARGATSELNFNWTVAAPALVFNPINTAPKPVNTAVNLTASVTNATNPQFKWSFGDGTTETAYSNTAAITHTYATPGLFVVRVTAKDATGITNTTTFIQAIHLPHTTSQPNLSANMAVSSNRLWVVNQDNDTVSVFNTATNAKVAEIAVGKSPRAIAIAPDGRIWVSNKAAATVSVINPTTLLVVQTINLPLASQPFGLVFAPNGSAAYVVLEATGKLVKLNPSTGAVIASLDVGTNPRHISIIGDSSKILVSRYITPPLPGESTAAVDTTSRGGEVIVVDTNTMAVSKTIILQHSNAQDTANTGAGIPNYLAMAAISPDGKNAWIPSKQDNIKRGVLRNSNNLNFQNTVRGINSKIDLVTLSENTADRIDFDNAGLASAATFDRSGNYLFVALETSREVAIVDAYLGIVLSRIQVGLAPDGLVVSADGQTLYVNNFMARTVSVVNLTNLLSRGDQLPTITATPASVATEKLAANVLKGKQLFYDARDPRLAGDAYLSCAACHNDGGHDGRVWDITGFGEGLRNTIDLRGRGGMDQGLLHATGNFDEIQDFEGQIRSLAAGRGLMSDVDFAVTQDTLGAPKATKSADLDALAAYVNSLKTFAPSPYRNPDGSLTAAAVAGKTLFSTGGCVQCHSGNPFTDSNLSGLAHDVGTIKASSGKRLNGPLTGLDTPTMRDVWNTAPYLHDGSAPTLNAAISAHTPMALSAAQINQVAAYIQQVGGSEPAAADITPPAVAVTNPISASINSGLVITVSANASDNVAVSGVQFKLDGVNLGIEDTIAPYSVNWNSTTATNGAHTLTAIARDAAGNITTSTAVPVTVNNTVALLPDVIVTSLSYSGGVFTATIKNQGTAATPAGVFVGVGYSVNGVFKTWGGVNGPLAAGASVTIGTDGGAYVIPNGTSTITADVDDINRFAESNETNNKLSQTITIGGSDTTPPAVVITNPISASINSGLAITVSANASDNVGVSGVQFKLDGVNLGIEDTIAPYSVNWNSTTATNGAHTLTAIARDAAGNTTTSTAVPVTVNNTVALLPDVIVASLSYSGGVFTATIKNQGTAATPAGVFIGVGYSVNGVYKTWGGTGVALAAGASITIGTDGGLYAIPSGIQTITADVDDINRFTESNETNNKLSQTITLP